MLVDVASTLLLALAEHLGEAHGHRLFAALLPQQEVRDSKDDGEPGHHKEHHEGEVDGWAGIRPPAVPLVEDPAMVR